MSDTPTPENNSEKPAVTQPAVKPESLKTMLRNLPPAFAFWAGVITAAAAVFAVGFIILVVLMLKGVDLSMAKNTTTNTNTTNTNSAAKSVKIDMSTIDRVQGTGDITILTYTDLECPYCKQFHVTMNQVMEKYNGKVRMAYKNFPLNIHPKAQKEAQAAECAGKQNKYWEFVDEIFSITPSNNKLDEKELYTTADKVGLDRTAFDSCLSNNETATDVNTDANEAQNLGATGTPFVVILDKNGNAIATVPGALPFTDTTNSGKSSMSSVLDQILQ